MDTEQPNAAGELTGLPRSLADMNSVYLSPSLISNYGTHVGPGLLHCLIVYLINA